MATPTDSIAQYIATDLALGVLGTSVFEEHLPDASNDSLNTAIAVITLPGGAPTLVQGDNTDTPGFQTICRSLNAATAIANDQAIFQALHGVAQQTIHGTLFKLIWSLSSAPMSLGRDERQRFLFARVWRAYVAGVVR